MPKLTRADCYLTSQQLHRWARQILTHSRELRLVTAGMAGEGERARVEMRDMLEKQCRLMERRARTADRRARERRGAL